jgi:hypothetical protein
MHQTILGHVSFASLCRLPVNQNFASSRPCPINDVCFGFASVSPSSYCCCVECFFLFKIRFHKGTFRIASPTITCFIIRALCEIFDVAMQSDVVTKHTPNVVTCIDVSRDLFIDTSTDFLTQSFTRIVSGHILVAVFCPPVRAAEWSEGGTWKSRVTYKFYHPYTSDKFRHFHEK